MIKKEYGETLDSPPKDSLLVFLLNSAVLISTMVGAQLFGISLSKIALIPLEIYLIVRYLPRKRMVLSKSGKYALLWFFSIILSSILGCFEETGSKAYFQTLTFNILQCLFIYLPIFIYSSFVKNKDKLFINALLLAAKINAVWAIVQYICWVLFSFDFNSYVFNTILRGLLGTNWTAWNYETGVLLLRATGLTNDAALLSVTLVMGFCLSSNVLWKTLFFAAAIFGQARSGSLIMIISIAYDAGIVVFKHFRTINKKRFVQFFWVAALLIIFIVYLYFNVPMIYSSINTILYRFISIFDASARKKSGTDRHLMYIPVSLLIFLFELPIVNKLFGTGIRTEGRILMNSHSYSKMLNFNARMIQAGSWAIECDYAEVLLGLGALGCFAFGGLWKTVYKNCNSSRIRNLLFSMAFFGLTYNYSSLTSWTLFIIFVMA